MHAVRAHRVGVGARPTSPATNGWWLRCCPGTRVGNGAGSWNAGSSCSGGGGGGGASAARTGRRHGGGVVRHVGGRRVGGRRRDGGAGSSNAADGTSYMDCGAGADGTSYTGASYRRRLVGGRRLVLGRRLVGGLDRCRRRRRSTVGEAFPTPLLHRRLVGRARHGRDGRRAARRRPVGRPAGRRRDCVSAGAGGRSPVGARAPRWAARPAPPARRGHRDAARR